MDDRPETRAGQLPAAVREFAEELCRITFLLDPREGWYGAFVARDPAGMRECLEGRRVPSWDVVASLLADLGRRRGEWAVQGVTERLRALHAASAAAQRARAGVPPPLHERPAAVRSPGGRASAGAPRQEPADRLAEPGKGTAGMPVPSAPAAGSARPEKRDRRRGARFAGLPEDAGPPAALVPPGAPSPDLSPRDAPGSAPEQVPRGARFAGSDAGEAAGAGRAARLPGAREQAEARRAAGEILDGLAGLRRERRTGEAHVVLCTVTAGPPLRLAVLVEELQRAGHGADADMLLWEAAALPPARLAAVADALAAVGGDGNCGQLLRQGVSRPAHEVGATALALVDAGRQRESAQLLGAFVRSRTVEEAVEVAHGAPRVLVTGLVEAARNVSASHARSLAEALRAAGFSDVPGAFG